MKARIKGTNIIVKCQGIGTLSNEDKGIECKHIDGSIEVIPADCLIELGDAFDIKEPFNWQSFRAEAAKDILCAIISQPNLGYYGDELENAVIFADKLISKLKEKEE